MSNNRMLKPLKEKSVDKDLERVKSKRILEKLHPPKLRVKLPPIESFQDDVGFRAEASGRVVVRLERLMGSNWVQLTDHKFISTLLERLEDEEKQAWATRTFNRKLTEKNRSRNLAIAGFMEPTSDMQDLYNHPVFRVNRVLQRIAQFDANMSHGQSINLPPIIPMDPFAKDDTGKSFKTYPGHRAFAEEYDLDGLTPEEIDAYTDELVQNSSFFISQNLNSEDDDEDEEIELEKGEEAESEDEDKDYEEEEMKDSRKLQFQKMFKETSLTAVQLQYGIKPEEDLEADWGPFRSDLVDLVFAEDQKDFNELYSVAQEVLGVYRRENIVTDDFCAKLSKVL